jgi:hypothetical protein
MAETDVGHETARLREAWEQASVPARVAFMRGLYQRSAEGAGRVEVQGMVGGERGEPLVELRWDDKILQWSPEDAIQHGVHVIEAAEAATHDAWFMAFITNRLQGTREQAGAMLLEMWAWRQRRAELPEDPDGVTG